MLSRVLADTTVVLHFAFILFVIGGGILVRRWPRLAWVHLPAAAWGVGIEFLGWICPLTYLENHWRAAGAAQGYDTSFVERYLMPLIYPELLVDGRLPRSAFIAIGFGVLAINLVIYADIWRRRKRRLTG